MQAQGPSNITNIIIMRLTMRGFICLDHASAIPEAMGELGALMAAGKMNVRVKFQLFISMSSPRHHFVPNVFPIA